MRKEDKITIDGIQITVKELTVAEVRHWMMDMIEVEKKRKEEKENGKEIPSDDAAMHVLDQGFLEEIGLSDIIRMTDLNRTQIDHFTPSELKVVIEKCKVLNPDFFGMRGRLLGFASMNV